MIRVGDLLYGFCGGYFGQDSYDDKRVEAVGAGWIVARDWSGHVWLYEGVPEDLERYKQKPEEES